MYWGSAESQLGRADSGSRESWFTLIFEFYFDCSDIFVLFICDGPDICGAVGQSNRR